MAGFVQPHRYLFWKVQKESSAWPFVCRLDSGKKTFQSKKFHASTRCWIVPGQSSRSYIRENIKIADHVLKSQPMLTGFKIAFPPLTGCKWARFSSPAFFHQKSSIKCPLPHPVDPTPPPPRSAVTCCELTPQGHSGGTYSQSYLEEQSSRRISKSKLVPLRDLGIWQPWDWADRGCRSYPGHPVGKQQHTNPLNSEQESRPPRPKVNVHALRLQGFRGGGSSARHGHIMTPGCCWLLLAPAERCLLPAPFRGLPRVSSKWQLHCISET